MKRGLVIGKFYPPHNGHHYLIETALSKVDKLDVLVCDSPSYSIPAKKRAEWLRIAHPTANVRVIEDLDDDENSKRWAQYTLDFLGYQPDMVFTSETYGDNYARYLGCTHYLVDKERLTIPISGTIVRSDAYKYWDYMKPTTRHNLATRIVVLGAESTGTTTLSLALARKLHAAWTPEVGRYYTESLLSTSHRWTDTDFTTIATMQQRYEDTVTGLSDGLVICDTNAFTTMIWQQRYMGHVTPRMKQIASKAPADLYIVTGDEIPFVQDGIRDGEHLRHTMHKQFISELKSRGLPYIVVHGSVEERIQQSLSKIDKIYQMKAVL